MQQASSKIAERAGPAKTTRKPSGKGAGKVAVVKATPAATTGKAIPVPSTAVALATAFSPPELLHTAILQGADVEVIERLSALAERWQIAADSRQARKAFDAAMADAKAKMPTIKKNRHVKFAARDAGKAGTDYWHEDLAEVVDTVQGVFSGFGLFFRWRTTQPTPGQVTVACILSHRDGHSEETELTAAVDTSGNKNHIQAIKSASTYLQRSTLLAAAGVAARGADDDGQSAGIAALASDFPGDNVYVTSDQISALTAACKSVGCSHAKFLDWSDVATFEEILAVDYDRRLAGLQNFRKTPREQK